LFLAPSQFNGLCSETLQFKRYEFFILFPQNHLLILLLSPQLGALLAFSLKFSKQKFVTFLMSPNKIIYTCYSEQITSRISSSDALNQRTQIPDLKKLTQG